MKWSISVFPVLPFVFAALLFPAHSAFSQDPPVDPGDAESPIETIAGTAVKGYTGDDGPAAEARLNNPYDVEVLPDGDVLIADLSNNRIRYVDMEMGIITTFAGNGIDDTSGNHGLATDAAISKPRSITSDEEGNLYIATWHQVRVVRPDGTIDRFAGSEAGNSGDGVPALEAKFRNIFGLTLDIDGGLLIVDFDNNKIFKVLPNHIVITIAGTGSKGHSGDGGPAIGAELDSPSDVAVDPFGIIYVAEQQGNSIRRITPDGTINTIFDSTRDPSFQEPTGLAIFEDLFLYISSKDDTIRRLNLFENQSEIVAGTGIPGFSGDEGPAIDASFTNPAGMDVDVDGWLTIADSNNHTVRRIQFPYHGIEPTPTPTFTPTPTQTPTLGPTSTPTRTPKPRLQTPTPTMVPTNTPTATPTPLPSGQLAPIIPHGFSLGPNYEFFTGHTQVMVPFDPDSGKVKILLSSQPDGNGQLQTSDTILLEIIHPAGTIQNATIAFSESDTKKNPYDLTSLFEEGLNDVNVRLIDVKSLGFKSSELYVVVFSAPELRDIPDIRALTGEALPNVLNLEDYIYDRDTPIADIVWTIESDQNGPRILRDTDNFLSVEASNIPKGVTFTVTASDQIFDASESVYLKVSSFRMTDFLLPDATLLEDYAYLFPYSLFWSIDPIDVNIADVPFETSFTPNMGIKAANVAHGEVYLFPEFPGGKVTQPVPIAITGKRLSDPEDQDGVVIYASSVIPPSGGNAVLDYNFWADTIEDTNWGVTHHFDTTPGDTTLGIIPSESNTFKTDGYGVYIEVDPGESVALVSDPIVIPPGPITFSGWVGVDMLDDDNDDVPQITLQLHEDNDSNFSYSTIKQKAIVGQGQYQPIGTTYNVIGTDVRAIFSVVGTHLSGRALIYLDNVRIFPSAWEIDRALGVTRLPVDFDGTFETVISGLGHLFEIAIQHSFGSSAYITNQTNRTVYPSGFNQALVMQVDESDSIMYISVGPNPIDESLYGRILTARAYVQVVKEGKGSFSLGISNGYQESVTNISNDRLPSDPNWHEITVSGIFRVPGLFDPTIYLQNYRISNEVGSGFFVDGADIAVDDITLEAYQDPPFYWDHKKLPSRKDIINQ